MGVVKHESGEGIEMDRQDAVGFYGVYDQELDELIDSLRAGREAGENLTSYPSPVLPKSFGQAATGRLSSPSSQTGDIQPPAA